MRKIMVVIAGLAVAAGAYLAGTAVQAHQDNGAQHQLMGAVVSGRSIQIDTGTYACQAQHTVQLYDGPIGAGPQH